MYHTHRYCVYLITCRTSRYQCLRVHTVAPKNNATVTRYSPRQNGKQSDWAAQTGHRARSPLDPGLDAAAAHAEVDKEHEKGQQQPDERHRHPDDHRLQTEEEEKLFTATKQNEKALRETQTLRAGLLVDPFPRERGGQNLISWRRSLLLPTNPVWWGSMHAISSYRGNRLTNTHTQTNKQTHRQDRLQYTAPLSLARSVITTSG